MKKYKTIYADPPWNVSLFSRVVRPQQLPHPYPKMKLSEIKALPVNELADEQCYLFLWVTQHWLPKAFEVIEAWGFNYHCCLTWDKTCGFTPMSFMWSTEFLLFAQRPGKWLNLKKLGIKTLFQAKSSKHSRKPAEAYEIIEKVSYAPRLELFARPHSPMFPKRTDWDVWGNEVESDVDIFQEAQCTTKPA